MRFAFVTRTDPTSYKLEHFIHARLEENHWIYDPEHPEIVISIGGDGTLLRSLHQYIHCLNDILLVGIHTGTLGFLVDYTKEEIDLFVDDLLHSSPTIDEIPLLEMRVSNIDSPFYAFNEVRIESLEKTLSLEVYIDDEFFELCNGSGVCICTQSGSTAVNRALHGAVIDSGLQVLQLCEIMPITHQNHHSLRNPYIMREDRIIRIEGESLHYAKACFDHLSISLDDVDSILIATSQKKVRFARFRTYSYLTRLKNLY